MPRVAPPGGRVYAACLPTTWRFHELPIAATGAMCLDGSPYGFFFDGGPGESSTPSRASRKRAMSGMSNNESWVIFFEGGGWCVSPEDCAMRAEGVGGSSSAWLKDESKTAFGGLVNRCCFFTHFCRFRRVVLKSCDGHSFAGNATINVPPRADRPLDARGAPSTVQLQSAGQAIVRGVLSELLTHFGLAQAKSLLVVGCSAGGMAALLNAEFIRSELAARGVHPRRFKVAALAGVFFPPLPAHAGPSSLTTSTSHVPPRSLSSATYRKPSSGVQHGDGRDNSQAVRDGQSDGRRGGSGGGSRRPREPRTGALSRTSALSPFEEQLRAAVQQGRMRLPATCTEAMPAGEEWRCLLGLSLVEALPHDLPAFVHQSRLDLWQANCVLGAGRSRYFQANCSARQEWRGCLGWMSPLKRTSNCSARQWSALRAWETANHESLTASTGALRRPGYGAFVHSCYDHCPSTWALVSTGAFGQSPGATHNDSVSARDALYEWFSSSEAHEALQHTHVGCWNGAVARGANAPLPSWCQGRQECGPAEKMHRDPARLLEREIRNRGWRSR